MTDTVSRAGVADREATTGHEVLVAFRTGVRVTADAGGGRVETGQSAITVRPMDDALRRALESLTRGPVAPDAVFDALGPDDHARLGAVLSRLRHVLDRTLRVDGRDLVRFEPTAREYTHRPAPAADGARVRLSPFALCRTRDGVLVLESPLTTVRVALLHPAARRVVADLGSAVTLDDLGGPDLSRDAAAVLVAHLAGAGVVEVAEPGGGGFPSDVDPTLRQWEFHDLLFHSRVRFGRYDDPLGGGFPHLGEIPPQPAARPVPDGPRTSLPRPDRAGVAAHDVDLTTAMEGRRSIRTHAEQPMTVDQLGEFLYRVQRTRVGYSGEMGELVSRPYPTGGSAYDIELYLTVRRCAGLTSGIYYYDPGAHELVLVNDGDADRSAMLAVAVLSSTEPAHPDVLITLTSRFQRLSWKYTGVAYVMTQRHVGIVYQTMYLVATAMRLAPCGLGLGNAELVARVLGLDPLREGSVGDFMLGSRPAGDLGTWSDTPGWAPVNDAAWAESADRELRAALDREGG